MDTRRLYYEDSHLRRFTATVTDCVRQERGWRILLDATAFYPEGGGQACDLGTLAEAAVEAVWEEDGQVAHLCDKPLEVGRQVEGILDWERRFDLMQQHSGEHIVSGIIHQRYGWQNMGFHIGNELVTVDVAGPVPPEELPLIEAQANRAIWENAPSRCWFPEPEALADIPYRSKKALTGPVRVVEFPGWDLCACCGTHVKAAGEVGLVKLISCVKFRQGVRIEMLSGGRAFAHLSRAYEQNRQVSQAFSAKIMATGEAARRMNEALAAEKFRAVGLQRQLYRQIAGAYAGKGDSLYLTDGLEPAGVRELAEAIAAECGGVAAVFSGQGQRYDVCLVCPGQDVKALGRAMAEALQGRGGGKPGFFQGNVAATEDRIRAFFRDKGWQNL